MKIINQKDNNNKSKKLKHLKIMQKINKIILIFRYDKSIFYNYLLYCFFISSILGRKILFIYYFVKIIEKKKKMQSIIKNEK